MIVVRVISKGQGWITESGRESQRIATDGDDSSRGQNKLSDVILTPQGSKGEEEVLVDVIYCINKFTTLSIEHAW